MELIFGNFLNLIDLITNEIVDLLLFEMIDLHIPDYFHHCCNFFEMMEIVILELELYSLFGFPLMLLLP